MKPPQWVVGLLALLASPPALPSAHAAFTLLNVGKSARLVNTGDPARNGGTILVRRDRALQPVVSPACPATSVVEVEAYLQSTNRFAALAKVSLDCTKWTQRGKIWRYTDPTGTVRSIRYSKAGLRIDLRGPGYTPIGGPVGFVQGQLTIGPKTLRARFHNFEQNDATAVRTRKPSLPAALGERGFWDILTADDKSEAHQRETIGYLERAAARDRRDGRSRFLLGMLYLYRFGQQITGYTNLTEPIKAELRTSNRWFSEALPLLWDGTTLTGDSRVIGFVGAGRFAQSVIDDDPALRATALADLDQAIAVNAFFNVFDLIPILQALPPADPLFQRAFATVTSYLEDPSTLSCAASQPALCANAGMAPNNLLGSLTFFGDLYAKAGNLTQANQWYGLANALQNPAAPWPFASVIANRVANVAGRLALYQDADPANDPPLVGAATEACAVCHARQ